MHLVIFELNAFYSLLAQRSLSSFCWMGISLLCIMIDGLLVQGGHTVNVHCEFSTH